MGSVHYMSPEQVMGSRDVDWRTDIYSLGITFYEALTGRTPFDDLVGDSLDSDYVIKDAHVRRSAPDPRHIRGDLPPALAGTLLRALEKDPALRFESCAAFLAAIRAASVPPPRPPHEDDTVARPRQRETARSAVPSPRKEATPAPATPAPSPDTKASPRTLLMFTAVPVGVLLALVGAIALILVLDAIDGSDRQALERAAEMEVAYQAGMSALDVRDWDGADSYFARFEETDGRYGQAQEKRAEIASERDSLARQEELRRQLEVHVRTGNRDAFAEAHDLYMSIPPTSPYHAESGELLSPYSHNVARSLVDDALASLERRDVLFATALLDQAGIYDSDVEGLVELREIAEARPRTQRRLLKDYRAKTEGEGDSATPVQRGEETAAEEDPERERGMEREPAELDPPSHAAGPETAEIEAAAIELYTSGEVDVARLTLEEAIAATSDPGEKLELQDVLGRIDYVERKLTAGERAMDTGDLDASLNSLEAAYKKITRMDPSSGNDRRNDIPLVPDPRNRMISQRKSNRYLTFSA